MIKLRVINKEERIVQVVRNKRKGMTVKAIPAFPTSLSHSKCLDCSLMYCCKIGEFCNKANELFGYGYNSFLFIKER